MGVATLARPRNTPVVLLCGALGPGAASLETLGAIGLVQPIADGPISLEDSMAGTARLLTDASARLARAIGIGQALVNG
jgi:glycerate kinase